VAVREQVEPAATAAPARERWGPAAAAAAAASLAIFLFYFAPYLIRHARVPAGFDPAWYVWRARFAGSAALGPISTASRPGHSVLSALLGSVTGRSQLELFVLFAQLLPGMLALGVGALALDVTGARRSWRLWVATVAVAGAALGATRLVGENLANLLTVSLEVAALIVLANAASRRGALWGSAALLVAAGLAHWIFLATFGLGLAAAVGLSVGAERRTGGPRALGIRDERYLLVRAGLWTAAIVGVLVVAVLRAPFRTFEIFQNPQEFAPKLITDVARLWPAGLAGLLGLFVLRTVPPDGLPEDERRRSFSGRMLLGWALAAGAGVLVGLVTLGIDRFALPPHRFLGLLVAVPGVVAVGAAVWWAGKRVEQRVPPSAGRVAAYGVLGVACALLAVPSMLRWYRYPILMRPEALQQAETAAGYVARLPAGEPFVFDIDARGPAVVYDAPLRERMIRMALPSDRQEDLHLFVGRPSDLLAGGRTHDTPLRDRITQPYWDDVRPILPLRPPVLVLRAMGEMEFIEAVDLGAPVIGPGVALLQGPAPVRPLAEAPLPDGVPATATAVLWALVLLGLLSVAGAGWTSLILGPAPRALTFVSLAPLVGTGALCLGAFAATESGIRLRGAGGVAAYVMVTGAGLAAAWWAQRRVTPGAERGP
jgi:hypothetical protein